MTMLAGVGGAKPRCLVLLPAQGDSAPSGDGIVLRRAVAELSRHADLVRVDLVSASAPRRFLNLLRFNAPPELARYDTARNYELVADALAGGVDVACLLHEGAFFFADMIASRGVGCVLYPHNAHSVISETDRAGFGWLFGAAAKRFERKHRDAPHNRVVCISRTDAAALGGGATPPLAVAPPGAPPPAPLATGAGFQREIALTGSYEWWRKRRHLVRFARQKPSFDAPMLVTDAGAAEQLGCDARHVKASDINWSSGLRVGLITDGFSGGFKLKALEYVALNCAVLSLCDLGLEFAGLPHADEFVIQVRDAHHIRQVLDRFQSADQEALVDRFGAFKAACLQRFDWATCLAPLTQAVLAQAQEPRES